MAQIKKRTNNKGANLNQTKKNSSNKNGETNKAKKTKKNPTVISSSQTQTQEQSNQAAKNKTPVDVDGSELNPNKPKKPCPYDKLTCDLTALADRLEAKSEMFKDPSTFGKLGEVPDSTPLGKNKRFSKKKAYKKMCSGLHNMSP